jgi:hypothetical protein
MESHNMPASEEEDDEADSDDDSDYDNGEDEDDENYGVYSVASKEEYVLVATKDKKKTKGGKMGIVETDEPTVGAEDWSQQQQEVFEAALHQFPKGSQERWDRISAKVPEKNKEQCMVRFKHIAEMVKKRKAEEAAV